MIDWRFIAWLLLLLLAVSISINLAFIVVLSEEPYAHPTLAAPAAYRPTGLYCAPPRCSA
jgi:hypothetical protein